MIEAIDKLDHQRKCFRLVGGVLVERTVGEVLPAVTNNKAAVHIKPPQLLFTQVLVTRSDQTATRRVSQERRGAQHLYCEV